MSVIKVLIVAVVALVTVPVVVSANTVTYYNYGGIDLTLVFTPNCVTNSAGQKTCLQEYPNLNVPANTPNNDNDGGVIQGFAENWAGNFFTFPTGSPGMFGVLGEMSFPQGLDTCYDTSTIVIDQKGITQENGVHFYYPKYGNGGSRISGCTTFPCPDCYSGDGDGSHTYCTEDVDLIAYLGAGSPSPPPPPTGGRSFGKKYRG